MNITFKLWMATNHMPFIRGTDNGIWRRLVIIPFNYQIERGKVDKDLTSKLMNELPGIFLWMLEGYSAWMLEGLSVPERLKLEMEEHKSEMDLIKRFLDDCCECFGRVKTIELYAIYQQWSNINNEHKYSSTMFGREISKKFKKVKSNGDRFYLNLSIKKELPFYYTSVC